MTDTPKTRDGWDKWEVASKIIGGISIPIIGLLVSGMVQGQAEHNRKAQLHASILAEREKSDSDVRAKMFETLLRGYFGEKTAEGGIAPRDEVRGNPEYYEKRIMFLDMVLQNFQENLNAKPLFTRLYREIKIIEGTQISETGKQPWHDLANQLIEIAKETNSRQLMVLERMGTSTLDDDIPVPLGDRSKKRVPLYSTHGLTGWAETLMETRPGDEVANSTPTRAKVRYSVRMGVDKVYEDKAHLQVELYRDQYDASGRFVPSESKLERTIEFDVSFFSTPYMDNTKFDGSRFSILYKGCSDETQHTGLCAFPADSSSKPLAHLQLVVFDENFLSQRDRPYVDKLLQQISGS